MVDIQPLKVRSCMMYRTCVQIKHSSSARGWLDHVQHTVHRPVHTPACSKQVQGDDPSFEGKRCNRILKICKGTDGKDKSRQFSQEENTNTHQHTMPSRHFWPEIPSTYPPPVRCIVIIDSKTESESEGLYPNDDGEAVSLIENQAGLPESQHGIIESSPPPQASGHVNHSVLNNNGEFFLKERYARTEFLVS